MGDLVSEQHLTESKEDALRVAKTTTGCDVWFVCGDDPVLVIRDPRGRAIARIEGQDLKGLADCLDGEVVR